MFSSIGGDATDSFPTRPVLTAGPQGRNLCLDKTASDRFYATRMSGPQKCLVTGAAGFIGSHLVDRLLQRGMTVVGVDNLKLGRRENLSQAMGQAKFKLIELDVNDAARLTEALQAEAGAGPFGMAWHLAANSDIRAGVANP